MPVGGNRRRGDRVPETDGGEHAAGSPCPAAEYNLADGGGRWHTVVASCVIMYILFFSIDSLLFSDIRGKSWLGDTTS